MVPCISNYPYDGSPRRSPLGIKNSVCVDQQDSPLPTLSLLTNAVDLPSVSSSSEAIRKFNIVEEDKDMLAISHSFTSEDGQKYGYGECSVNLETEDNRDQEDYSKDGFPETSTDMIIDDEDGNERQGSVTSESTDTRKVFCPKRMPRRSSMKGWHESCSPSPVSRRNSIGVSERYEVFLPGRSNPIQRRRSITFDNRVTIQKVEPARALAADPQSLWFQEIEYEAIKLKTLALLDQVDPSSGVTNRKQFCIRGLEKFMEPESAAVKKHQAWDCVLNEQFLQRQDGEFDAQTIADIYRYSTKRSQNEASKRARQDAEDAQAILKTTF